MGGPTRKEQICGVVLAGGRATRMGGGDKCLLEIGGKPLLNLVLKRTIPQVDQTIINANGDPERFAKYGLPVIPDTVQGHAGPLAGILAGMLWTHHYAPQCTHIFSVAGDTPFFPKSLVRDLSHAMREQDANIGVASSGGRMHPTFGIWSLELVRDLQVAVEQENVRRIRFFMNRHRSVEYAYEAEPFDPFFNINTPDDIKRAEKLAGSA